MQKHLTRDLLPSFIDRGQKEEWRLVETFDSAYWGGLDANVYIDKVKLDDFVQLNYQVVEQVRPYYGYADYVARRLYHGTRIITGELTINFKRFNYLYTILRMAKVGESLAAVPAKEKTEAERTKPVWMSATEIAMGAVGTMLPGLVPGANRAEVTANVTAGLAAPDTAKNFVDAAQQNMLARSAYHPSSKPVVSDSSGVFETTTQGFDLYIRFGEELKASQQLRFRADGDYYRDGKVTPTGPLATSIKTSFRLKGVSFLGTARPIGDDGRPLVETYNFIARNIELED